MIKSFDVHIETDTEYVKRVVPLQKAEIEKLENISSDLLQRLKELIVSSKFHHSNTTDKAKSMYHYGMTVAYEGVLSLLTTKLKRN